MGSSNSTTRARVASARPIATRCRCPPDICAGRRRASASMPSISNVSRARDCAADLDIPRPYRSASVRLSSALRCGYNAKCWNTMDTSRRCGATPS
jgi:hypothetical protein